MGIISDCAAAFPEISAGGCFGGNMGYEELLSLWEDIYRGEPPWAYVKRSGLYGKGDRRLLMLCCAKVLCDSLASLTFSSQADIICEDKEQQEFALRTLQENGFWEQAPAFLSRAYALGGGAMKVFAEGGRVTVDSACADCFMPLGCGRGGIDEGVFENIYRRGGVLYRLLEKHSMKDGHVCIDRALFSDKGVKIDIDTLFPELPERAEYPSVGTPMFAYFRPAAANNLTRDGLMGISCFANCIDTLKAIDIAFDSFSREFVLGRKRIIVPSSCIRTVVDPDTGNVNRYFDTDDEVYQALKCDEEKDLKITDNTCELRVDEHVNAINALLDILCFQTGLSSGTLSFTGGAVKTAAEVKSMETRTEITMQQNRCMAAEFMERLVGAVLDCGMLTGKLPYKEKNIRIAFSDRQTVDKSVLIDRNIRMVSAGLLSRVSALMAVTDCSEEEARNELDKIIEEENYYERRKHSDSPSD